MSEPKNCHFVKITFNSIHKMESCLTFELNYRAHCSSDVINTLHLIGMIPIPSPELKDRRSVIAKKVRNEIHDTMEAKVKDEIERAKG